MGNSHRASWTILWLQVSTLSSLGNAFVTVFPAAVKRAGCEVHKLLCGTGEVPTTLTPSLPQPVKFPGSKIHGRACKQCISSPITHLLWMLYVSMKILSRDSAKNKTETVTFSNFALLLVVVKWHHGSEGVNVYYSSGGSGSFAGRCASDELFVGITPIPSPPPTPTPIPPPQHIHPFPRL